MSKIEHSYKFMKQDQVYKDSDKMHKSVVR